MRRAFFTRSILIVSILTITLSSAFAEKLNKKLKKLEAYYEQARLDWKVPGMAIAIVKDDSLIFSKGFGVKNVDSKEAVDANTLFAIASNTKAFTATALLMLAEEGKLSIDDKVTDYLPWFKTYDPFVTSQMTIRDLLCHRSGLKTFAGDLIWYGTDHSAEEVVRRSRYLEPSYGFRENFGYSNIMYIAAGLVIEEVSGLSWNDYIQQNILQPLGMNRTVSSVDDLESMGNYAICHNDIDDEVISIPYLNWDNAAAVGGLLTSANDISKWLKLQLNHGIYKGDTLFSESSQNQMWAAHTVNNVSNYSKKMYPSTHFKAYGLGWGMFDYHGRKIIRHSGGYDGMLSVTVIVPEEDLAFVVYVNKNSGLYNYLAYKTLDVFLSDETTDWSQLALERAKNRKVPKKILPTADTKPSLDLEDYDGTYGGKVYGDLQISFKDNQLFMEFGHTQIFKAYLKHYHYDTFEFEFEAVPSLPKGKVTFSINARGKVESLIVDLPNPDFDFTELDFIKK